MPHRETHRSKLHLLSKEPIESIDSFDLPDVAEEYSDDLNDDLTNE